ncbi:hypothetical protein, partial [Streptomyces albidoflavus]|uniref:hypothetical protein n=1 Tax=Streptomyces albidoflavus TaxID=1886 RepID=UPI0033AD5397
AHEHAITEYAVVRLLQVPDLRIIGPASAEDRGRAPRGPGGGVVGREGCPGFGDAVPETEGGGRP